MFKKLSYYRIALFVTLIVGTGITIWATSYVSKWVMSNRQLRFQKQIDSLTTTLQRSFNRYTDLLEFLGDHYGVQQSSIDRKTFAVFVTRALDDYPGIQALEWAPLIRSDDRLNYERQIRTEGYRDFEILEIGEKGKLVRANKRSYYIPVTYIEPLKGNESALGYDLSSEPSRAIAIAEARDTGKIKATKRISLVQDKSDGFGFLLLKPTYREYPPPTTITLRRQKFIGVVLGVFRVSDVVEESLVGSQRNIDFMIFDENADPKERFLGRYKAEHQQVSVLEKPTLINQAWQDLCPFTTDCTRRLTVGQRTWLIKFSPSVNYPMEAQYDVLATLIAGLGITCALVLFLYQFGREIERKQELNDSRVRFFSMASHELRNSLVAMLLTIELLQTHSEQLTEEQKRINFQKLHSTARQMNQQIADLLLLTQAEAGRLNFHPEVVDLEVFCQRMIKELHSEIVQNIDFNGTGKPVTIYLDKKLLRSLLTNLLINAAKYSPEDTLIALSLEVTAKMVILCIKDQGMGIPQRDLSRITEIFYRGSNVGDIPGSGLGLAIVNTCVKQHRGTWQIDSQVGRGTIVIICLPYRVRYKVSATRGNG